MAANAVDAGGPMPDVNVAADALDTSSTQIRRRNNIPAIAWPQVILDAILQLGTQINERMGRLEMRMDRMEKRMVRMGRVSSRGMPTALLRSMPRLTGLSDGNNIARLHNAASISLPFRSLEPLVSVRTGDVIANFPATVDHVDRLPRPAEAAGARRCRRRG